MSDRPQRNSSGTMTSDTTGARTCGLPWDGDPRQCDDSASTVLDDYSISHSTILALEVLDFSLHTKTCHDNQPCVYLNCSLTIFL